MMCSGCLVAINLQMEGGATRAAMTQHHAVRGNMADVSAKDSAQETAVNLIASFTALLIITLFGNSLIIFALMMVLHIVFNYFAVRAVCLKTLNEPRFLQLIDLYLKKEVIATHCEINRNEPIVFCQIGPNCLDLTMCGFQIKLGYSIKKLIDLYPKALYMKKVNEIYEDRNYMLLPNIRNRAMYVLIKEDASTDDLLCAYFHAVLLSIIICAINDVPLPIYLNSEEDRPFAEVCRTLQAAEWSREAIENPSAATGFSYDPSYALMRYVNGIVQKEWERVRDAMNNTGWDLSKHLLMVDEWRVSNGRITQTRIYVERTSPTIEPTIENNPRIVSFGELLDDFESMNKVHKEAFTIEPEKSCDSKLESDNKLPEEVAQQKSRVPHTEPVLGINSDTKDTKKD